MTNFTYGMMTSYLSSLVLIRHCSHSKTIEIARKVVDLLRHQGHDIPDKISERNLKRLMDIPHDERMYFLRSKFNGQLKRERQKELNEKLRIERLSKMRDSHICYSLYHNSMLERTHDPTVRKFIDYKAILNMQDGINIAIDCSFDKTMSTAIERNLYASQLTKAISINRNHKFPAKIHLCNFDENLLSSGVFARKYPPYRNPQSSLHVTCKSYLSSFPKEKLIYISQSTENEMEKIEDDAIYIFGGIVNKSFKGPMALDKARAEGIRALRFPFDRYLRFRESMMNLELYSYVAILLDKQTNEWHKALYNVPPELLYDPVEGHYDKLRTRKIISLRKSREINFS